MTKKPQKEDLTCAFHGDLERCINDIKKRLNWVYILLLSNLLASGLNLAGVGKFIQ